MQGTYVCDATNSIGTRSGSVEVSIIGTVQLQSKKATYCYQYFFFSPYDSVPPKLPTWMWVIFYWRLCFLRRKTTATDRNRWCHQRYCFITGCWSAYGHYHYSASAQDKKPKGRLFVRQHSIIALIFPTCFVPSTNMVLVCLLFLSLIRSDSPSRKLSQPIRKRPGDDIQVTYVY